MIQLLTFDDVAEILKVSRRQVARLVDSGKIPVLNLSERSRRILANDLEEYIRGNVCRSGKEVKRGSLMSRSARSVLEQLCGVTEKPPVNVKLAHGKELSQTGYAQEGLRTR